MRVDRGGAEIGWRCRGVAHHRDDFDIRRADLAGCDNQAAALQAQQTYYCQEPNSPQLEGNAVTGTGW